MGLLFYDSKGPSKLYHANKMARNAFLLKELFESRSMNTTPAVRATGDYEPQTRSGVMIQRPFIALLLNAAPLYSGRRTLINSTCTPLPFDLRPFVPQPSGLAKLRAWRALATQDSTTRHRWMWGTKRSKRVQQTCGRDCG